MIGESDKVFIITGLAIILCLVGIPLQDAASESMNADLEKVDLGKGKEYHLSWSLKSKDAIISNNNSVPENYSPAINLYPSRKAVEYYYINNNTATAEYQKYDRPLRIEKLNTTNTNKTFDRWTIKKFQIDKLGLEKDDDNELDINEPIIKDNDFDFQISYKDEILRPGKVNMTSMKKTSATYFTLDQKSHSYEKGLAIINHSSNNELTPGELSKGETQVLTPGKLPLVEFHQSAGLKFAINNTNSQKLIGAKTAIIETNISRRLYTGPLDKGPTQIIKGGEGKYQEFSNGSIYHVNPIGSDENIYSSKEALIKDTTSGIDRKIDYTDKIVKAGNASVETIGTNTVDIGSGSLMIGNSTGDQIYEKGEFIYAESGENPGYQPKEDIVITEKTDWDLSKPLTEQNTCTEITKNVGSNIAYLDLNQNDEFDLIVGKDVQNKAEPIIFASGHHFQTGDELNQNYSILKAANRSDDYNTISGRWKSDGYIDIANSKGPYSNGELGYISTNNTAKYSGNEVILEDNRDKDLIDSSDYIVVGGETDYPPFVEIPSKYKFIDEDLDGQYGIDHPIILDKSGTEPNEVTDTDILTFSGNISKLNNFSEGIEYFDQDGSNTYNSGELIVKTDNPNDGRIIQNDTILNPESDPANPNVVFLGNYPSDPDVESQYYLSKKETNSYSTSNPIVSIKPISSDDHNLVLQDEIVHSFLNYTGAVDKNLNGRFDKSEPIFRENDTDSVGPESFGDRLDAVTVTTTGTLGDQYVNSISLSADGRQIATASAPTANGTWILDPTGEERWFGPDEESTRFTLDASIADDAPGGETLALEIPTVADADGDGAYDPGETGLFLEQGPPIGDVGPGATLTVERTSDEAESPAPPLGLEIETPANVSAGADLAVTIAANRSERRDLTVEMRSLENESHLTETTATLDADGETQLSFTPSPGRYRVRARTEDGNASTVSAPIHVRAPGTVTIQSGIESLERGDRTSVTVEATRTENMTVHLEGPGNHSETARVSLHNGSGRYRFGINSGSGPISTNGTDLSLAPGNTTARLRWLTALRSDDGRSGGNEAANTSTAPAAGAKNGSAPPRGNDSHDRSASGKNALPAGEYALSIASPDGSEERLEFTITAGWQGRVQPLVAPRGVELDSVGDVRTHATQAARIATGDRLVAAVETPVFENATERIAVGGPPAHAAASGQSTSNRSQGRNQSAASPPAFVAVGPAGDRRGEGPTGLRRINASEPGRFYVVAPLENGTVSPGTAIETALTLTEETAVVPAAANGTATASRTASLDVVEANATLHGVSQNGSLDLPPGRSVPINGTTTVAPGTTATIHLRGANGTFDYERETTVSADGTYEAVLNVSDREAGESYSVTVTADGDRLSPVRTGEFVGSEASGFSAAQGGGGGGGGGDVSNRDATEPTVGDRTVAATATVTPADPPPPVPVPEISREAVRRTWDQLTEPVVLGVPSLVVIAFGGLAVLVIGFGVKRLFDP